MEKNEKEKLGGITGLLTDFEILITINIYKINATIPYFPHKV